MKKLVRNGYADIISQDNKTKLTVCPLDERTKMLVEKLFEEVRELKDEIISSDKRASIFDKNTMHKNYNNVKEGEALEISKQCYRIAEEIGDVKVVLNEIKHIFNIKNDVVSDDKTKKFGKFNNYIVLETNE